MFLNKTPRHKEWRKMTKKLRRSRIRRSLAAARDQAEKAEQLRREQSPTYQSWVDEQNKVEQFQKQEELRLAAEQEQQWLKDEAESHRKWKELQIKLQEARERRAAQTARIKLEWEEEQRKLRELKEKNEREAEERKKRLDRLEMQINEFIDKGGDVPEQLKTTFETNPNKPTCPFFQKTGACRFNDTCSRNHIRPGISETLLFPGFYSHYSLEQTETEHGNDSSLEFENDETYNHFKEFFFDVLPELEKYGCVKQFKVCCNHEPHLRGNVYVEYSSCRQAITSYRSLNGRWYGGKQIHAEFCSIDSWKSAICGLYYKHKCPKGSACNFLHVFRNPGNMFGNANKDKHHLSVPERESVQSEARNWRWSESPDRIPTKRKRRSRSIDSKDVNGVKRHKSSKHKKHSRDKSESRERRHKSRSPKRRR